MKQAELQSFKTFLLNQKSSILNKTEEFKTDQLASGKQSADDAELVSNELSMTMSIQLHERDRAVLLQIEKALGKIEAGTYGQCESCTEIIESKRLQARPFATLCIDCMEEHEDPRRFLN